MISVVVVVVGGDSGGGGGDKVGQLPWEPGARGAVVVVACRAGTGVR